MPSQASLVGPLSLALSLALGLSPGVRAAEPDPLELVPAQATSAAALDLAALMSVSSLRSVERALERAPATRDLAAELEATAVPLESIGHLAFARWSPPELAATPDIPCAVAIATLEGRMFRRIGALDADRQAALRQLWKRLRARLEEACPLLGRGARACIHDAPRITDVQACLRLEDPPEEWLILITGSFDARGSADTYATLRGMRAEGPLWAWGSLYLAAIRPGVLAVGSSGALMATLSVAEGRSRPVTQARKPSRMLTHVDRDAEAHGFFLDPLGGFDAAAGAFSVSLRGAVRFRLFALGGPELEVAARGALALLPSATTSDDATFQERAATELANALRQDLEIAYDKRARGLRIAASVPVDGRALVEQILVETALEAIADETRDLAREAAIAALERLYAGAARALGKSNKRDHNPNIAAAEVRPSCALPEGKFCAPAGSPCDFPGSVYPDDPGAWDEAPWTDLDFAPEGTLQHRFCVEAKGQGADATFTLSAHADLDCDGTFSTFRRTTRAAVGEDGACGVRGPAAPWHEDRPEE